jgi:hypothetical protein
MRDPVMPLLAAAKIWIPFETESITEFSAFARLFNDAAVKKLLALSKAELTFLPVARRFCVANISEAVFCNDNRFCRTLGERVIEADISSLFWRDRNWQPPRDTHKT